MSVYAFHPEAFIDLDEIWEFVAAEILMLLIGWLQKFPKLFANW